MNQLVTVLFILVMAGCSACRSTPKLEKEVAREQIERYLERHPENTAGTTGFEAVIKGRDSGTNAILFRLFIGGGLLRIKEKLPSGGDTTYLYGTTEKGRPYLVKETLSGNGYPFLVVRTFDYYLSGITDIRYSPDGKEAAVFFYLAIRNLTPFGKLAADPDHRSHYLAIFSREGQDWNFQRIEIDPDQL